MTRAAASDDGDSSELALDVIQSVAEIRNASGRGELSGQRGNDFEEVAHQAVVGDLENGRLRVLVDGNDHLAVLHPRQVLDRAGDADGHIEIGRDDLARLTDLVVVGNITCVDGRTRRADRRIELVGERFEHLEVVAACHAAAARYDYSGASELGTLGFRQLLPYHL